MKFEQKLKGKIRNQTVNQQNLGEEIENKREIERCVSHNWDTITTITSGEDIKWGVGRKAEGPESSSSGIWLRRRRRSEGQRFKSGRKTPASREALDSSSHFLFLFLAIYIVVWAAKNNGIWRNRTPVWAEPEPFFFRNLIHTTRKAFSFCGNSFNINSTTITSITSIIKLEICLKKIKLTFKF